MKVDAGIVAPQAQPAHLLTHIVLDIIVSDWRAAKMCLLYFFIEKTTLNLHIIDIHLWLIL